MSVILSVCVAELLVGIILPRCHSNDNAPGPYGPAKPTPVGITNFVGIGYNVINGNPQGGDMYIGGVDPGFLVTRPILKLTYNDGLNTSDLLYQVPDQVVFSPRSSCVRTSSQEVVYGTESYTHRISVDVSMSGKLYSVDWSELKNVRLLRSLYLGGSTTPHEDNSPPVKT